MEKSLHPCVTWWFWPVSPRLPSSCLFKGLLCQIICHCCAQAVLHFHSLSSFLYDCLVTIFAWFCLPLLVWPIAFSFIKGLVSLILIALFCLPFIYFFCHHGSVGDGILCVRPVLVSNVCICTVWALHEIKSQPLWSHGELHVKHSSSAVYTWQGWNRGVKSLTGCVPTQPAPLEPHPISICGVKKTDSFIFIQIALQSLVIK